MSNDQGRDEANARRPCVRRMEVAGVACLLVLHVSLALSAATRKSPSYDEPAHLVGGYVALQHGDYRFAEVSFLPNRLFALPMWIGGSVAEPSREDDAWRKAQVFQYANALCFDANATSHGWFMAGRAVNTALAALLGLVVYLWSRRVWGALGGFVSLILYALSPTMLAHGAMTTLDVAAALALLLACGAIWQVVHKIDRWSLPASLLGVAGVAVTARARLNAGWVAPLLVSVLALHATVTALAWPHYLAYFNPLHGGPSRAYRHVADSSLDWGQDLPRLCAWIERQRRSGYDGPVYLSYFGMTPPERYGVDATLIQTYGYKPRVRTWHDLTAGVYCVSATMLQSIYSTAQGPWCEPYEAEYQRVREMVERYRRLTHAERRRLELGRIHWNDLFTAYSQLRHARLMAWLRHREPDDQIGHAMLIYRLSENDIAAALIGPPVELHPSPQIRGFVPTDE